MRLAALIATAAAALVAAPLFFDSIAQEAGDSRIDQLEQRIQVLEQRQAEMEKRLAQAGGPTAQQESAATQLLQEVQQEMSAGRFEEAKAKLDELNSKYAGTNAQRRAGRLNQELSVIGKSAPDRYEIERWFQGEGEFDLTSSKPTLIVFWEEWCPHCKREVPKMQDIYTRYKPKGLQVVGLTKVTRSSTDESVMEFCRAQKVMYPIAKETGTVSRYFNVSGIPAAAAVKDGKVIWRGHPATLTDQMIESWIGG
jgi:thiol-disulfide isomerase/thioredoxin